MPKQEQRSRPSFFERFHRECPVCAFDRLSLGYYLTIQHEPLTEEDVVAHSMFCPVDPVLFGDEAYEPF
jgi:hypothetical protein